MTLDWQEVWEKKGSSKTEDLKELDGYESTSIEPKFVAKKITQILEIKPTDKVLEVGCGAGMLAQYLECNYIGVDYSKSLVKKHIELLKNSVIHGEANNLIFKDKSFDKVFSYSVFQYFSDLKYANIAIQEMRRVSTGSIFIGDLPIRSHSNEHLLYEPENFEFAEITEGFYNSDRFNILIRSN